MALYFSKVASIPIFLTNRCNNYSYLGNVWIFGPKDSFAIEQSLTLVHFRMKTPNFLYQPPVGGM